MAQNIDDFYIQIAKNAQTRPVQKKVNTLNKALSKTDFGEAVIFFGPSTRDVSITDVLRRGSIFAMRPIEEAGFRQGPAGSYFHGLDSDHLKILKEQRIKDVNRFGIPNDVYRYSEGIYLNAGTIERASPTSFLKTVYHELGHAASYASEAADESLLLREASLDQLYESKGLTIGKVRDLTTNVLLSHALEEGRAEQFALELIQKGHLASGKSSAEDILSRIHLAYLDPSHYDNYLLRYDDSIQAGLLRVDGLDKTLIPKLADDIKLDAKASAIGAMHGHFRMISGEFGPLVKEKAKTTVNESFDYMYNSLNLSDEKSDYLAQRIREASEKVVDEGRHTVFGKPLPEIQVTFTQSSRAAAASPALNPPIRVARAARSSRLVQASKRTAKAVMRKNSTAMGVAKAARKIFT